MLEKINLKVLAYIGIAGTFVWLGFGMNKSGRLLDQALAHIDSARTEIRSARQDMSNAKILMDSAQQVMNVLKRAAETAEKDLNRLKGEREKIHVDITNAIAASRQDLKRYGNSIQELLNEQNRMLHTLDSINIRTLIVVPAKTIKK